jgi:hypothetical protein
MERDRTDGRRKNRTSDTAAAGLSLPRGKTTRAVTGAERIGWASTIVPNPKQRYHHDPRNGLVPRTPFRVLGIQS